MDYNDRIYEYAGYSAYIASHALTECGGFPSEMVNLNKKYGDLSLTKCRWLIREFNNNSDGDLIASKWKKMFSSLNKRSSIRVKEFFSVEWDERAVMAYYWKLDEARRMASAFGDAVFIYGLDLKDIAKRLGMTKGSLWDIIDYNVWVPDRLISIVKNSLPIDEGFPGRFQINIGEIER